MSWVQNAAQAADDVWARVRERWFRKRTAYRHLFYADDLQTLNLPGELVLADLARFCRAFESTAIFSPVTGSMDPIASAKADGRREVWLRIQSFLHADESRLRAVRNTIEE